MVGAYCTALAANGRNVVTCADELCAAQSKQIPEFRIGTVIHGPVAFHGEELAFLVRGQAQPGPERRTLAGIELLLRVVVLQMTGPAGSQHGHTERGFHGRAELVAKGAARDGLHHDHVFLEIKPRPPAIISHADAGRWIWNE